MTSWNPDQYQRFSDHRLRPALELLARVPAREYRSIYDLGCGPGTVTRLLLERWPGAAVCGIDSSRAMLDQAASDDGCRWLHADIDTWTPDRPPDLIYSNAALHWLEEHARLFPRLMDHLKPGGCLAVQMPLSWPLPSHRLMREVLNSAGPDGEPLGSQALRQAAARRWVEDAEFYYRVLSDYAADLDIWETEYLQILQGDNPVLEWIRGTGLRPILDGLQDDERAYFLQQYDRRLRQAYPPRADGHTLYPFRRLFIVAIKE